MDDYDVVIVGGGPAGLTAGIYCGRARLRAIVLEKESPGGSLINAERVENFPGFPEGISGAELTSNMMSQAMAFGTGVEFAEVTSVEPAGGMMAVATSSGTYRSKAVVLAGGARYRKLGVPGEQELFGEGIFHCAMCDGGRFADQAVAVVGGGEGGLTEGLYMTRIASKVTVIEVMPKLSAPAIVQERARSNPKLEILLSTRVVSVGRSDGVRALRLRNTETGREWDLRVCQYFSDCLVG